MDAEPESPFYIKPRLNWDLITWGLKFWRASTQRHVERSAPLLRDLSLASRKLYAGLAEQEDFGLVKKGLLMLCKTQHGLDEEAVTAEKARAWASQPRSWTPEPRPRWTPP
ncbi:hypothetical protein [Verrucomicrobium spinosum]|uniref:hypothetical protein n=1 Tax=Verrucomicrobium spinosum TaxID=2736 RepID=UPI000A9782A4|nr:hypothetical protein [Verrucomicrobium spinosum]